MVNYLEQEEFRPGGFPASASFLVHRKPDSTNDSIAVFVHGLGGDPYSTWRLLPELLFSEQSIGVDIGLFRYTSFYRRLFSPTSAAMETIAVQLATEMSSLPYRKIVLIGHSMGGLLSAKAVIYFNHNLRQSANAGPKLGLVQLAPTRAGSLWSFKLLPGPDARFLRRHGPHAIDVNDYFTNEATCSLEPPDNATIQHIPCCVVVATSDKLVDRFSAAYSIPASQISIIVGTHRSVCKPDNVDQESYRQPLRFLHQVLTALDRPRSSKAEREDFALFRFRGHTLEPDWEVTYSQALNDVRADSDVEIVDSRYSNSPDAICDLSIVVVRARNMDLDVREHLAAESQEQALGRVRTLAVSAHDQGDVDARPEIQDIVGSSSGKIIERFETLEALRSQITKWMQLVVDLRPKRGASARRADLRNTRTLDEELKKWYADEAGYL